MGVVYSAYDPELDRKVALKLLRADAEGSSTSGDAPARLLREAQALAKLSHPNVISIHDVGTVEDRVFMAVDFVDGGTLQRWLAERKRTWREIRDAFIAAGRGLAAAHAAGLVHRDFKPANVLVSKDGQVRVTDFGLVRPSQERANSQETIESSGPSRVLDTPLTRSGALVGTPAYMAPEQLTG